MAKEADELISDPHGRWFRFNLDLTSLILMERKHLSSHLTGLSFVEVPTPLNVVVRGLEDAGEACPVWK